MEAAYNDAAGITAEFNRNMMHVLNAKLGANFDPAAFRHVAFFDEERSWIEMRLRAVRAHRVDIPRANIRLDLEAGEDIRTEVSVKFAPERIESELVTAGMRVESVTTDQAGRFALALAARS